MPYYIKADIPCQLTLFEMEAPQYEKSKASSHGKIFTLTQDRNQSGRIDIDDLEWDYLEGASLSWIIKVSEIPRSKAKRTKARGHHSLNAQQS